MNWPVPEALPALLDGEIHLWCAWLGAPGPGDADLGGLSADEAARARALHFPAHRHHFVAARRNLRRVLGAYTGRLPTTLAFSYGRFGKPALADALEDGGSSADTRRLQFNQSHCGALWLLAVTRDQPVGVDVEAVRQLDDLDLLENTVFSAAELPRQQSLPSRARQTEFFRRWTEREATAKLQGVGLDPALTRVPPGHLVPLSPAAGYAACLAYDGPALRIRPFCWNNRLQVHPPAPTVNNLKDLRSLPHRHTPSTTLC